MFERQSEGATPIASDDQPGDLDNLTLTSRSGAGCVLGTSDVVGCDRVVAATGSQHGEQGVLDGEVGHADSMRGALTPG